MFYLCYCPSTGIRILCIMGFLTNGKQEHWWKYWAGGLHADAVADVALVTFQGYLNSVLSALLAELLSYALVCNNRLHTAAPNDISHGSVFAAKEREYTVVGHFD